MMAKMRRLQKISPIMQKFLHEAANTTFCRLESWASEKKVQKSVLFLAPIWPVKSFTIFTPF